MQCDLQQSKQQRLSQRSKGRATQHFLEPRKFTKAKQCCLERTMHFVIIYSFRKKVSALNVEKRNRNELKTVVF